MVGYLWLLSLYFLCLYQLRLSFNYLGRAHSEDTMWNAAPWTSEGGFEFLEYAFRIIFGTASLQRLVEEVDRPSFFKVYVYVFVST